jgi:hypothetical protein
LACFVLKFSLFCRGDKATSSVRLRKRRDDPNHGDHQLNGPQQQEARRKNRHSGDFAFFSPSRHASPPANGGGNAGLEEDFNYITFPNGVPVVQEVRVGGATANSSSPARGGVAPQQQQQQHPIRVTMRDINIKESDAASVFVRIICCFHCGVLVPISFCSYRTGRYDVILFLLVLQIWHVTHTIPDLNVGQK